jgi:hypothetical protein
MSSNEKIIDFDISSHKSILLGRGPTRYQHPGNRAFRDLVKSYAKFYEIEVCNAGKKLIARNIHFLLLRTGYRFLYQPNTKSGGWIECSADMAMRKIQHTLRDMRVYVSSKGNAHHHVNPMLRQVGQDDNFMCLTCQNVEKFSILNFNRISNSDCALGKQLEDEVCIQVDFPQRLPYKKVSINRNEDLEWKSTVDSSFFHNSLSFDDRSMSHPFNFPCDDPIDETPPFMKRTTSCESLQAFLDSCFEDKL